MLSKPPTDHILSRALERRRRSGHGDAIPAVPVRHWGRWLGAIVALVALASLLHSLWVNPNLQRDTIGKYLFVPVTLTGVLTTIELTVIAMAVGAAGGVLLAIMRLSKNPVLTALAWGYTWFFRGTPLLVQIIFWGYLGALYPQITLALPFPHIVLFSGETNQLIGAFTAALLALGLNEAAFAAEIVRGGILSVDRGQSEAAISLSMSHPQTLRKIVLPQAMRAIIPPMGSEVIGMLKNTSLVSVIAGHDLLTNLQNIYEQTYQVIPLLAVASLWYLALTTLLSIGQYFLERHFAKGFGRGSSGSGPNPAPSSEPDPAGEAASIAGANRAI
jgi:polar amino acid transport system permease protein